MSHHINGYIINVKNMQELDKFFRDFRKELVEEQKNLIYKLLAEKVTYFLDKYHLGLTKEFGSRYHGDTRKAFPLVYDLAKESQKQVALDGIRDPFFDISFSLTWFYYRNKFYAMPFVEQKVLRDLFTNKKEVLDFAHWNHSDHPSNLTRMQWKQRGKTWDNIIPSGIPRNHGYSFEGEHRLQYIINYGQDLDLVVNAQNSLKHRVSQIINEYYCSVNQVQVSKVSDYLEVIRKLRDDKKLYQQVSNEIKKKLKAKYNREDFLTELPIRKKV